MPVRIGAIYKHKKGGFVQVLGRTRDSETLEIRVVYEHVGGGNNIPWDRTEKMWEEVVEWSDGVNRPRFVEATDEERRAHVQYLRGKEDAVQGQPPTENSISYKTGYREGTNV